MHKMPALDFPSAHIDDKAASELPSVVSAIVQGVDDPQQLSDIAAVFCEMFFPTDPARQREIMIDYAAHPKFWPKGMVSVDFVRALREIPSRAELRRFCNEAAAEGEKAGFILRVLCSLCIVHKREDLASLERVRRAIHAIRNNKYKGYSPRTLENTWKRFASVAHLWAAWIGREYQLENWEYFEDERGSHSVTFCDDFKLFLLEAEDFADFGMRHRHQSARRATQLLQNPSRIDPGLRATWQKSLLPCALPRRGREERGRAAVHALDRRIFEKIESGAKN
jgi:hypothetical protein